MSSPWSRIINYTGRPWPLILGAAVIFAGGISLRIYLDHRKAWKAENLRSEEIRIYREMDTNLYSQSAKFAEGIDFEAPTKNPGYLRGKVMVIDVDHMSRSGELEALPRELWALTPEQVGTVVVENCYSAPASEAHCETKVIGEKLPAYMGFCRIKLIEWPEKKTIVANSFQEGPNCSKGTMPTSDVSSFLKNLPLR
jgi:hypothetical protein